MITPGQLNLIVYRWTPFIFVINVEGMDLSAATFAMDWRGYRDAPGAALVSLVNAASNAQGLSCSVTTDDDDVPTSHIQIRVNETTIEGLLLGAAGVGKDVTIVHDLHVTGGGLPKSRLIEGEVIIRAGATQ